MLRKSDAAKLRVTATQGLAGGVPGNVPHRPEDQEPQDGVRQ